MLKKLNVFFKSKQLFFIITVVVLFLMVISLFILVQSYQKSIAQIITEVNEERLLENLNAQRKNITEVFARESTAVELVAQSFAYITNQKQRFTIMGEYTAKAQYDHMLIVSKDGSATTNTGEKYDIAHREYFKKVLQTARTVISEPIHPLYAPEKTVIMIATPIFEKNAVESVVVAAYDVSHIKNILTHTFKGKVYNVIVSNDGNPLILSNLLQSDKENLQRIKKMFVQGSFVHNDDYISFSMPLGINNWYIFSLLEQDTLTNFTNINSTKNRVILLFVIFIIVNCTAFILFSNMRVGKRILFGFLLVVMLAGSSGVFCAVVLTKGYDTYSASYDSDTSGLFGIAALLTHLNALNIDIRSFLSVKNNIRKTELLKNIEAQLLSIEYDRIVIQKAMQTKHTKEIWAELEHIFIQYNDLKEKIIAYGITGTQEDTAKAYDVLTTASPLLRTYAAKLEELAEIKNYAAQEIDTRLKNEKISVLIYTFLVISLAFMFAVVSAFVFARNISRPLKEIEAAALLISENNTDFTLRIDLKDEIGTIARVLDPLVKNALNELNMYNLNLETEVNTDPLTQLYNRRYLENAFKKEIRTLSRAEDSLAVLMLDIDYFKNYNDTYGHSAGDDCLCKIAQTLKNSVERGDDFAARYGGEEFVVVLPSVGKFGAELVAKRILENVRNLKIEHKSSKVFPFVTVSLGITCCIPKHNYTLDNFIQCADQALYKSKNRGRNQSTYMDFNV